MCETAEPRQTRVWEFTAVGGVNSHQSVARGIFFPHWQKNSMPRNHDRDDDTAVSISFSKDPTSKGGRSKTQDEQLAAAREVALNNRRRRLKVKLEQRLVELRSKLGDLRNDQIERVVAELIQVEDRHRSKLHEATEHYTDSIDKMSKRLELVQVELNALKKATFKENRAERPAKSVGTLSDVSTLRN